MSTSDQANAYQLRDAYYAGLHRDVMVYEALDEVLVQLTLPSQGLRSLCHDELSADHQKHMLRAVARLAVEAGLLSAFELLNANIALARRDWPLIAELGIHGVSYDQHSQHLAPEGSAVNRLTPPGYYASATWRFSDHRWIPRIHGEGHVEQVARHLTASLIAIAATRHTKRGAEQ